MKHGKSIMLYCECEHAVHFEENPSKLSSGNSGSNHLFGTRATRVVPGNHGLYYCGPCDSAGHGVIGQRVDPFQRFQEATLAIDTFERFLAEQ